MCCQQCMLPLSGCQCQVSELPNNGRRYDGVGLSAPQVGVALQILMIQVGRGIP